MQNQKKSEKTRKITAYLSEDLGKGDVTSLITPKSECKAIIKLNENCVIAGLSEISPLCRKKGLRFKTFLKDGMRAKKGKKVAEIFGENRKIMGIERVSLNLLGRMSGVATLCAKAIQITGKNKGSRKKAGKGKTTIAVTRKTIPGFQEFDKKAAAIGGAWTHRKDLNEMVLLKENHLRFFDSAREAVKAGKRTGKKVEIEVESEKQAMEAAAEKPYMIMLDNFSPEKAGKAVKKLRKAGFKGKIELSGGITLKNLSRYSKLGADVISMGELTKNAKIIDFGLEIERK